MNFDILYRKYNRVVNSYKCLLTWTTMGHFPQQESEKKYLIRQVSTRMIRENVRLLLKKSCMFFIRPEGNKIRICGLSNNEKRIPLHKHKLRLYNFDSFYCNQKKPIQTPSCTCTIVLCMGDCNTYAHFESYSGSDLMCMQRDISNFYFQK